MKLNRGAAILIIYISLSYSCSTTGSLVDYSEKTFAELHIQSFTIEVNDSRCAPKETKLEIPVITGIHFDESFLFPALDSTVLPTFKSIVENNTGSAGFEKYIIIVDILEGFQLFYTTGGREKEFVHVKLRTRILEKETNKEIANVYGKMWGEKKTLNASYKSISKLYQKAMNLAFVQSLDQWLYIQLK